MDDIIERLKRVKARDDYITIITVNPADLKKIRNTSLMTKFKFKGRKDMPVGCFFTDHIPIVID